MSLTDAQKRELLQLARDSIAAHLAALPLPLPEMAELHGVHAGVFVSLHIGDQLRGCIGYTEGRRSLPAGLQETAISAATRDPRFEPLTSDELAHVIIEISVVSPLYPIASPEEIVLGKHGVMAQLGPQQGLLLPQVAWRHNWDVETFLAQTCRKADLPLEAWKNPETEIFIFEAEIFSEAELVSKTSR